MRWIAMFSLLLMTGCASPPGGEADDAGPPPPDATPRPLVDTPWVFDEASNGTITASYTVQDPRGASCSWSHSMQVADGDAFRMSWQWSVDQYVEGSETTTDYEGNDTGGSPPIIQVRTPVHSFEIGGTSFRGEPFAMRTTTTGTVRGNFTFLIAVSGLGQWDNTVTDHLVELAFRCDAPVVVKDRLAGGEFHLFGPPWFGNGVYAQQWNTGLAVHAQDEHEVQMTSPVVHAKLSTPGVAAGSIDRRHPGGVDHVIVPGLEPLMSINGGPGQYGVRADYVAAGTLGLWASYIGLHPLSE